jgi:hypothetical protein
LTFTAVDDGQSPSSRGAHWAFEQAVDGEHYPSETWNVEMSFVARPSVFLITRYQADRNAWHRPSAGFSRFERLMN